MPQSPEETRGHRIRLPLALTTGAARCYSNTKKKRKEKNLQIANGKAANERTHADAEIVIADSPLLLLPFRS